MKSLLVVLLAWLACTTACLGAPSNIDTPIGHVTLPKGKYVLTNTDTGSTVMINIDEHGIVRGHRQAVQASLPTPAASPTAVNPVAPVTVQPAPDAAGSATSANSQKAISDKLKREAQRALKRGDVQKLIRKVGL